MSRSVRSDFARRGRGLFAVALLAIAGLSAVTASAAPAGSGAASGWSVAEWPEADALFHRDRRWLGADCAYSVDLGKGRVLWLFGDTFVSEKTPPRRRGARMPRNTV